MIPHRDVLQAVMQAYAPCPAFRGACESMRWDPLSGHVPRGFAGALKGPKHVELVLVTAEPGDPYDWESYPARNVADILQAVCEHVYRVLESGSDLYHRNFRYVADRCFPALTFAEQMSRIWLTDSVLCSARVEGGSVPVAVARECRHRYLEAQLALFPQATVVALGGKAAQRLRGFGGLQTAFSIAPPGCNFRSAKPSWDRIATLVREKAAAGDS